MSEESDLLGEKPGTEHKSGNAVLLGGDGSYRVSADELRQFIEHFERLESERKDILEQQKEVMAEAKARGYDTKAMRKIIAERKKDADERAEEEAVFEMYAEALGMG